MTRTDDSADEATASARPSDVSLAALILHAAGWAVIGVSLYNAITYDDPGDITYDCTAPPCLAPGGGSIWLSAMTPVALGGLLLAAGFVVSFLHRWEIDRTYGPPR